MMHKRKLLLQLSVVAFLGCESQNKTPPHHPTIKVEQTETDTMNTVSVYYSHHDRCQFEFNEESCVHLNSIEEILAYKKQVEFLLKTLDEAERKMTVHEDTPKTNSP